MHCPWTSVSRSFSSFCLLALLACSGSPRLESKEWFVAPEGNDLSDGSSRRPFQTLERARRAARSAPLENKPRLITLKAGTYRLAKPLVLTPSDSGTPDSPIVYRAARRGQVRIRGSIALQPSWTPYRLGIFQTVIPKEILAEADFDVLSLNGQVLPMARYPNLDPQAKYYGGTAADAISPERVRRWEHPTDVFVHGLHRHEWGDFHYRILGVNPQGVPQLEGGWQNNRRMGLHPQHRFVENAFEELDAPGEWFFNPRTSTLYLYPPAGIDLKTAVLETTTTESLIEIRGTIEQPVRHVRFEGLHFSLTRRAFMKNKEPLLRSDWTTYRGGMIYLSGAEDCRITQCDLTLAGGNAIYLDGYNRRVEVSRCLISDSGASAVSLVGNPRAVRSPSFEYGEFVPLEKMDLTPGPQSPHYPADCLVQDCLIRRAGRIEKQSAGVQVAISERITIRHNTIHDLPRAGINLGDGCWGGHLIEGNDVFDTVKETGDHGSFNSWGRERYWLPDIEKVNRRMREHPELHPLLDARALTTIQHNRWRCDHGWDIDLDDGSSHFLIRNNVCLNGGLKLREGYHRTVENNVMINNTFHPHVWFQASGDVFRHNIVMTWYAPIGMPKTWGREVDRNLLPDAQSLLRAQELGLDKNSVAGDPQFRAPARGDYRVTRNSPALKVGFRNFRMDQFGTRDRRSRGLAATPLIPSLKPIQKSSVATPTLDWLGAPAKGVRGMGEVSASGLPGETGVTLLTVPASCAAARHGLLSRDVILSLNDIPLNAADELIKHYDAAKPGTQIVLRAFRNQEVVTIRFSKPTLP
ncbi:MAG: PDZ domain-containing protein [Verrucomicrobiales bacterium]|nr:PDZ domain-containing protein [Verrucomicrobiales bacterium]